MKTILLIITFSLFLLKPVFSQEYSNKLAGQLDFYIGNLGQDELYATQWVGWDPGKGDEIVAYAAGTFTTKLDFRPERSSAYKYWFIYENTLNAVVVGNDDGKFSIRLRKYNASYELAEEIALFSHTEISPGKASMLCRKDGNHLGIIGSSGKKNEPGFAVVLNLIDHKFYSQLFSSDKMADLRGCDLIINKKGEMLGVFEGKENLSTAVQALRVDKLLSYILSCTSESAQLKPIVTVYGEEFIRSFRFCKTSETSAILGGLCFVSGSGNMLGYWMSDVRFGDAEVIGKVAPAAGITAPELWPAKAYKRVLAGKAQPNLVFQFLKEVRLLSDGSFLFISEGQLTSASDTPGGFKQGVDTQTGRPGAAVHVSASPDVMSGSSFMDIIVSRVTSSGIVSWTNKTKFRQDDQTAIVQKVSNRSGFVVDLDENAGKLLIYYTELKKSFGADGSLKDKFVNALDPVTTLAVLETDLSTGRGQSKAFFSGFEEMPDEIPLPLCSYTDAAGETRIMLLKGLLKKEYRQVKF